MNREEFLNRIETVDRQLGDERVPVHARAFAAFRRLADGYEGPVLGYGVDPDAYPEFVGPNLLKRICEWYRDRYGERVNVPSDRGRVPILLRGQIYLIRIPLV